MKASLTNIRESARDLYKSLDPIYCPYFKEEISFTSEGFKHIRYRNLHERHYNSQEIRYKLLQFAPKLLKKTSTLQEYETQKLFVEIKQNKKKEKVLKDVYFYGFIAILSDWKVKVIVRQVGNGKKHFWSIIPNWRTRKSKENKKQYINHTGNMSED